MRFLRRHPCLRSHSVRLRLCSGAQLISRTGSLLRVKLRRTQCEHMFSALPSNSTLLDEVGMSQGCQQQKSRSRLTRSNRWCRRTRRRVTLEVPLCGGPRYTIEAVIRRRASPVQKCENQGRVRTNRPRPPLPLLRVPDEPGPTLGNDKRRDKAGSGGRPSWLPRLPHRNDQDR